MLNAEQIMLLVNTDFGGRLSLNWCRHQPVGKYSMPSQIILFVNTDFGGQFSSNLNQPNIAV